MKNAVVLIVLILQFVIITPQDWYEYFSDGLGNFRYGYRESREEAVELVEPENSIFIQKLLDLTEESLSNLSKDSTYNSELNDTVLYFFGDTETTYTTESETETTVSSLEGQAKEKPPSNTIPFSSPSIESSLGNKQTDKELRPNVVSCKNGTKFHKETKKNCSASDLKSEFPDRIGTNAIITLAGPPG